MAHTRRPANYGYPDSYSQTGFAKLCTWQIVMEYCELGAVTDIAQRANRVLSEAEIACVARATLRALAYVHKNKKIHRDIKVGGIVSIDHRC